MPVGLVLLILILTSFLIDNGWRLGLVETWDRLYTASTIVRVIMMLFATYLIYPLGFLGGANRKERIIASFTPHFIWLGNEFVEMVSVYSVGETLYSVFNPGFLFFIVRTFFQIALCDLACRWLAKNRFGKKHSLSNRQAGLLLVGSPILQGIMIVFFIALIDIYWMIHRGVFL